MTTHTSESFARIVGTADAFALVAAGFTYPELPLAEGFVSGAFLADSESCLNDMGVARTLVESHATALARAIDGANAEELLREMRAEYTRLYFAPGKYRLIMPYESAFKRKAADPSARAAMFVTRATHEVERAMKSRNALPESARREPADFFATELDFTRHLFTGYAAACAEEQDAESWRQDAQRFLNEHVASWIPVLFEQTEKLSDMPLYKELARLGRTVIAHSEQCFN